MKQKAVEKFSEEKPVLKAPASKPSGKRLWGLFHRRPCLVPTWRGWLLLVVVFGTLSLVAIRGAYPFLAVNDPRPGGVLVVEGWAADYALEAAVADSKQFSYEKVYVTGGPIEWGAPLSSYKTYAESGTATLLALGMSNVVQAVPAPRVKKDRTYACAVALKKWVDQNGVQLTRMNLVTVGPHARRSRLLFQKAFGKEMPIGVVAVAEPDYDGRRWWKSSLGFRAVTGEAIAYLYARFLFRPTKDKGDD